MKKRLFRERYYREQTTKKLEKKTEKKGKKYDKSNK